MVKVSVIVPVYNVEKYLERCLNSILKQTLTDIEIICVNDGSTDNSGYILEEYQSNGKIKIINQLRKLSNMKKILTPLFLVQSGNQLRLRTQSRK